MLREINAVRNKCGEEVGAVRKLTLCIILGTVWGMLTSCVTTEADSESIQALESLQYQGVLYVPQALDVLKLDHKNVFKVFGLGERRFELAPGLHEIELRYSQIWDSGFDDHQVVKSQSQILNINIVAGAEYRLNHDKATSLAESVKVAEDLKVWITTKKESTLTPIEKGIIEVEQADSHQLQQLKYWWERTSEVEKNRFKVWQINAQG